MRPFFSFLSFGLCLLGAPGLAAPWLAITEISYRPLDPALEFVEIAHTDTPRVELGGFRLAGSISFTFPADCVLLPGEVLVVARSPEALCVAHPGLGVVLGPFSGELPDAKGRVELRHPFGALVAKARYRRDPPWSAVADGTGHTLELVDPASSASRSENWRASRRPGGTPGSVDDLGEHVSGPFPVGPLLSEVAFLRRGEQTRIAGIEIRNPSLDSVDLSSWWLSSRREGLRGVQLPSGTVLSPRAHFVVDLPELAQDLPITGGDGIVLLVSPDGDAVVDALRVESWLTERLTEDGTLSVGRLPGDTPREFARHVDAWRQHSLGTLNKVTASESIAISEIAYNPPDPRQEFVEITCSGDTPVDIARWQFSKGIAFTFPEGTHIAPGEYLVVARDPTLLARAHSLPPARVLGPFTGRLADGGEDLVLVDAKGHVADRVEYADRGHWPRWADGLGSSLELRNARLDNSLPGAWRASDETLRTEWVEYRYTAPQRRFAGDSLSEFQLILLDEGECLVSDVRVRGKDQWSNAVDVVIEPSDWTLVGTHSPSGTVLERVPGEDDGDGDGDGERRVLHLRSDGRGNPRHNNARFEMSEALVPDRDYEVSFRARWLRGSPYLLTRTAGQGLARTQRLKMPARIGTPGRRNSADDASPAPVVGTPLHWPLLPRDDEHVRFDVRCSAHASTTSVTLRYRRLHASEWQHTELLDDGQGADLVQGDGRFAAIVPPVEEGRIEFFVEAIDDDGRRGTFPEDAPSRAALWIVGHRLHRKLPTWTLLVRDGDWRDLESRERMSNLPAFATLLWGDRRVFHDVRFRRRGSPWTRGHSNWRVLLGADDLDGRKKLTLDGQGGGARKLTERLTYWMLDQIGAPTSRQRYVWLSIPGHEKSVYEDVEKVDGDYLSRWFQHLPSAPSTSTDDEVAAPPDARDGQLYKVDDWFELYPHGGRDFTESYLEYGGEDPELYRWNFPARGATLADDYDALIDLIRFMDPEETDDAQFAAEVEDRLDVDTWLRVLAARGVVDDWDTFGRNRGKNAYLYRSPRDGRWRLLPWDCDLSWRDPYRSFQSYKFPSVERLLDLPRWRRRYHAYAWWLADRSLHPDRFRDVLGDVSLRLGRRTSRYESFASERRSWLLDEIGEGDFIVESARRIAREGEPDLLQVEGTAPAYILAMVLEERAGTFRARGELDWRARFPIGPEGGPLMLRGLDFGRRTVAEVEIEAEARPGAMPLPPTPAVEFTEPRALPEDPAEEIDAFDAELPSLTVPSPAPRPRSAPSLLERLYAHRIAIAIGSALWLLVMLLLLRISRAR